MRAVDEEDEWVGEWGLEGYGVDGETAGPFGRLDASGDGGGGYAVFEVECG